MRIHCSKAMASLLQACGGFQLESRGVIDVKGKGPMETYWVTLNQDEMKSTHEACTAIAVASPAECDHITVGGGFEQVSTVET